MMRTLAIGDIHGKANQLAELLQFVELTPQDLLITLGDYVDRGPDSRSVIEQLIALRETHRVVSLRGNHDQLMIEARDDPDTWDIWRVYGASATLDSYGPHGLAEVPDSHWHFLTATCRDTYETDTHIFVHGHIQPDLPIQAQPISKLHWLGIDDAQPHSSNKTVICGHRPQDNGRPLDRGFAIGLDTRGWLTCMDVTSTECWQVSEDGRSKRRFPLRA